MSRELLRLEGEKVYALPPGARSGAGSRCERSLGGALQLGNAAGARSAATKVTIAAAVIQTRLFTVFPLPSGSTDEVSHGGVRGP